MYKFELKSKLQSDLKPVSEMKIGQIGRLDNKGYRNPVVLRTYESVVSLENPNDTWPVRQSPNLKVEIFPDGTIIELTSGLISA